VTSPLWRRESFKEIPSTNTYLVERARAGEPAGLVVRADFQSAGRGRLDRKWEAPPRSGLMVSILLRPELPESARHLANIAVALAAREAVLILSGVRPDLKWPNDLLLDGRKVGGLLAEFVVDENNESAIVVGCGINLTWDGPPEVHATSLRTASGVTISLENLLDMILRSLDTRSHDLNSEEGRQRLQAEYRDALVTLGQSVRVQTGRGDIFGVATDVDSDGRLSVLDAVGGQHLVSIGDVVHLRPAEAQQ